MRKLFLNSTVAAAALMTGLGVSGANAADPLTVADYVAEPRFNADLAIFGGAGNSLGLEDGDYYDDDFLGLLGAYGRVAMPLGQFSVQLDAFLAMRGLVGDGDSAGHAAVHFGLPQFGAMVSIGLNRYWEAPTYAAALEARVGGDRMAFTGQFGGALLDDDGDLYPTLYGHAEGRLFFGANSTVAGNLGFAVYDEGTFHSVVRWGLDIETALPGSSRYSLFLSYQGSLDNEWEELEKTISHVAMVGMRIRFGGASASGTPHWVDWNPYSGINYLPWLDWM